MDKTPEAHSTRQRRAQDRYEQLRDATEPPTTDDLAAILDELAEELYNYPHKEMGRLTMQHYGARVRTIARALAAARLEE